MDGVGYESSGAGYKGAERAPEWVALSVAAYGGGLTSSESDSGSE